MRKYTTASDVGKLAKAAVALAIGVQIALHGPDAQTERPVPRGVPCVQECGDHESSDLYKELTGESELDYDEDDSPETVSDKLGD